MQNAGEGARATRENIMKIKETLRGALRRIAGVSSAAS
jgi:hypothetical protein